MTRRITTVFAVLAVLALVAGAAAATPAAAQPSDQTGDGPAEGGGPPDFVGDLLSDVVPDFVSDLLEALPVPEFLKNLF